MGARASRRRRAGGAVQFTEPDAPVASSRTPDSRPTPRSEGARRRADRTRGEPPPSDAPDLRVMTRAEQVRIAAALVVEFGRRSSCQPGASTPKLLLQCGGVAVMSAAWRSADQNRVSTDPRAHSPKPDKCRSFRPAHRAPRLRTSPATPILGRLGMRLYVVRHAQSANNALRACLPPPAAFSPRRGSRSFLGPAPACSSPLPPLTSAPRSSSPPPPQSSRA